VNIGLFAGGRKEIMTSALTQAAAFRNKILRGLPREKYELLFSNIKLVNLAAHQVLYHPDDKIHSVYFINNGLASLLSTTTAGDTIEVGNVGNAGLVGGPVILRQAKTPYHIVMRVPGDAWMVSTEILKQEFEKPGELKDRLLAYHHGLTTYISQLGVCNHFHTRSTNVFVAGC
jgi:CRP-like cAMP-binding protein